LKPENIRFEKKPNGEIDYSSLKVVDFGSAGANEDPDEIIQ
jgi:hypothetical protein